MWRLEKLYYDLPILKSVRSRKARHIGGSGRRVVTRTLHVNKHDLSYPNHTRKPKLHTSRLVIDMLIVSNSKRILILKESLTPTPRKLSRHRDG